MKDLNFSYYQFMCIKVYYCYSILYFYGDISSDDWLFEFSWKLDKNIHNQEKIKLKYIFKHRICKITNENIIIWKIVALNNKSSILIKYNI